jgi:allophanate hydrolase
MTHLSLDVHRLSAAYRDGSTTPEQVITAVLRRIASAGDDHVWISRPDDSEIMEQAQSLTRRANEIDQLPLYGLPFAIKDSIDVAGFPTTLACPAFARVPAKSALVIERLIEAGAIFVGKTNLDQFATGLVGVRSPYGTPRNPFDPAMIPGGSSSGSAVAVAAGLVSFAVATDTAGSGRVPAAFNNIVGYKPTRGLFSVTGLVPACRSADCVTLLGLTVPDVVNVARVMQWFDPADAYARRPPGGFMLEVAAPPKTFRFGVPRQEQLKFFGDAEGECLFAAAIERARALGGEPIAIDYAPWVEASSLLYGPWVAERTADLGEFIAAHRDEVDPVVRDIILGGDRFSAVDLFKAEHRLAELRCSIALEWDRIDFMLVPTTGTAYTIEEVLADPIARNTNLGYYTNFTNLLDMAGMAIPGGFNAKGFPAGVTLIGPAWSDARLASYAAAMHQAAGTPLGATGIAQPDLINETRASADGRVEIVVFGAHMRGEPLNHELTGLGAVFNRSCQTAARYRMFALEGAIQRPALGRDSTHGRSLAGELWSLPLEALGSLLARIGPPLGLGKVLLDDEQAKVGFICEAGALTNARDISEFGGWRAYRASIRPA